MNLLRTGILFVAMWTCVTLAVGTGVWAWLVGFFIIFVAMVFSDNDDEGGGHVQLD